MSENGQSFSVQSDILVPYAPRSENLRSRSTHSRPALRWALLHRGDDYTHLLSPHLSGASPKGTKCSLLSHRCGGCGSRPSSLPALPTRMFSGDTGLDGDLGYGIASVKID